MNTPAPNQLSPGSQMMQLISNFWVSCCIYTAARLNLADRIAQGPQTVDELARLTNTHAPSLYRLLRALASVGIFSEEDNRQFTLTPLGTTLQSDVPGSMKDMALTQLGDHFRAWGNLHYSIQTGQTAFDHTEGMPLWEFYQAHPAEGLTFMRAMTGLSGAVIANILAAYDFSVFRSIVDVGGGNGTLMMAMLEAAPQATGIVFDEAYVLEETQKALAVKGFGERCRTVAGSFFESVPAGADAYTLKMILHDWDDDKAGQILRNCCEAMQTTSRLLIMDSVIPEGNEPHPGKFMDINMLVMTSGRERTEREFAELLRQAGLRLTRVMHTPTPLFSIVEAVRQ